MINDNETKVLHIGRSDKTVNIVINETHIEQLNPFEYEVEICKGLEAASM